MIFLLMIINYQLYTVTAFVRTIVIITYLHHITCLIIIYYYTPIMKTIYYFESNTFLYSSSTNGYSPAIVMIMVVVVVVNDDQQSSPRALNNVAGSEDEYRPVERSRTVNKHVTASVGLLKRSWIVTMFYVIVFGGSGRHTKYEMRKYGKTERGARVNRVYVGVINKLRATD